MRASATHAGRGLSSSLIRTTTFHIKIHKVWQLHVISADVWLGILCFFSYGCWRRRGFNWVVTFYMIVSRCWWTHAFGLASAFLLCCVFFFFVDFLKILEVPSNSVCSLARQRIEHAGDPPVQAFGVRILMTASRVWRVDIPSSGSFTWWNLLNHVAFPTSRYLYFHFTKMWDPFHLASWKLHLEARRNVTNSDVPYSTKERLWPSFWPGLAGV